MCAKHGKSGHVKFLYVSPSILPSRAANAVHVVMQCEALTQLPQCEVTLLAQRSVRNAAHLPAALSAAFGTSLASLRLKTVSSDTQRMTSLRIAGFMLTLGTELFRFDAILSRNLYASWILAVLLKRPLLFETHQLESGFRKCLQRSTMLQSRVTTIVISRRLAEALVSHHGRAPRNVEVLHDAAPAGISRLESGERQSMREQIFPEESFGSRPVCGYFGHLYAGRGIEIIIEMARRLPQVAFLIAGGNVADIARIRSECSALENVHIVGHLPYQKAQEAMASCDILLMPYQRKVSIGIKGHDTARWMSPMKMFEYMGAGVPIISSRLPALEEVLVHERNCLMVTPDDPDAWVAAMKRLFDTPNLAEQISSTAHNDYQASHTWLARAHRILEIGCARDD